MKLILKGMLPVLLLCLTLKVVQAQNDFEIPPQWNKENAIITQHSAEYSYLLGEKGKDIEYTRREILQLFVNNEQGAKELEYIYLPKDYNLEITLIKADGLRVNFDEGDAEELLSLRPGYLFTDLFRNYTKWERIFIGPLGEGDEIKLEYENFFEAETKEFLNDKLCRAFEENVLVFPTIYPKGGYNVDIEISSELYINYADVNSAPKISEEMSEEEEPLTKKFSIRGGTFEALKSQFFLYAPREMPTARFEVVYCKKDKIEKSTVLAGKPGELSEIFMTDELKRVTYNKIDYWDGFSKVAKEMSEFSGEARGRKLEDIVEFYYKAYQNYAYNTGKLEIEPTEDLFMGCMIYFFTELEYTYNIVVGAKRRNTSLDDVLLNDEIVYGLKINDGRESVTIYPATRFSNWNDKNPNIAGQVAYIFTPDKKLEEAGWEYEEAPMMTPADNQTVVRTRIKIGNGFTSVVVNQNESFKGLDKQKKAPLVVTVPEYHEAMLDRRVFRDFADMRDEVAAQEKKDARVQMAAQEASTMFDTVEYQRFNLKSTGHEDKNEWLQYKSKYIVPDKVIDFKIIDSIETYVIALGKFLQPEYILSPDDYKRDGDVYIDYPRIKDVKIRFDIPSGYTVFGFENLENKVETDLGSIESVVKIKSDELILDATIVLKEISGDRSEWAQLALMLSKFEKVSKQNITMVGGG